MMLVSDQGLQQSRLQYEYHVRETKVSSEKTKTVARHLPPLQWHGTKLLKVLPFYHEHLQECPPFTSALSRLKVFAGLIPWRLNGLDLRLLSRKRNSQDYFLSRTAPRSPSP